MIQSTLFENSLIADAEFSIISEDTHICNVWEIMRPALKKSASRYISRMQGEGDINKYIGRLIQAFQNEQDSYLSFFKQE